MMNVFLGIFLGSFLLLHIAALGNIIYNMFKLGTKFNMVWAWIINLLPLIGPILYFSCKRKFIYPNSKNFFQR
jgi:hypothetical protein